MKLLFAFVVTVAVLVVVSRAFLAAAEPFARIAAMADAQQLTDPATRS